MQADVQGKNKGKGKKKRKNKLKKNPQGEKRNLLQLLFKNIRE